MSWHIANLLGLAAILSLHPQLQAATDGIDKSDNVIKIKILLYDFVPIPEKIRTQVRESVVAIFRGAGVQVEWAPCPTVEGQLALFSDCTGYKEATTVSLRVLPQIRKQIKADAAGESMLSSRIVNVFWDRAQKASTQLDVPLADMLAAIVAHEVGHVFLGPNSHALSGIMLARWKPRDLVAISQGGQGFTARERESILAEVRRRQAQQAASDPPPVP